jgi:hypothetical protein
MYVSLCIFIHYFILQLLAFSLLLLCQLVPVYPLVIVVFIVCRLLAMKLVESLAIVCLLQGHQVLWLNVTLLLLQWRIRLRNWFSGFEGGCYATRVWVVVKESLKSPLSALLRFHLRLFSLFLLDIFVSLDVATFDCTFLQISD